MNKKKIAVIGSGISGLSASFFLSKKYDVHLFEKNKLLGGHTRTVNFLDNLKNLLSIDTGFIVFNEINYPDLVSFFKYLEIKTKDSEMSFAVSCKNPNIEYGGTNFKSLFAQKKNIFSIKFLKLLFEINKLYKFCKNYDFKDINEQLTIEQFLDKNNFSKEVRDLHIYPMISSIWSTNNKDINKFPLVSFLQFFNNHNLFNLDKRPQWKFVAGGSYRYVEALIKKNLFNIYTNFEIKKITRENNKIQLIDSQNKKYVFDKIIFATHADQAIRLLDRMSNKEADILSKFKYTKNKAYLHSDYNFMPKNIKAWSSWNFLQNLEHNNHFSLTYWMNKLQKINNSKNYFVSINPYKEPKNFIDSTTFAHPIFNLQTLSAQKKLGSIQGINNTFYCGSYCGYGFHEDGIQSAAYISNKLNVDLPWKRPNEFKSRLNY